MDYMALIELANRLHDGQKDKAGRPYIGHCLRVAMNAARGSDDPALLEAALLHDVVEDGCVTLPELYAAGVSMRACELIAILTKGKAEPYAAYLARVKCDPDAVLIKRADLADNLDRDRLAALPHEVATRLLMKYTDALEMLNS